MYSSSGDGAVGSSREQVCIVGVVVVLALSSKFPLTYIVVIRFRRSTLVKSTNKSCYSNVTSKYYKHGDDQS